MNKAVKLLAKSILTKYIMMVGYIVFMVNALTIKNFYLIILSIGIMIIFAIICFVYEARFVINALKKKEGEKDAAN